VKRALRFSAHKLANWFAKLSSRCRLSDGRSLSGTPRGECPTTIFWPRKIETVTSGKPTLWNMAYELPPFKPWAECVAALDDATLERFAEWRGYSDGFCRWLRDQRLIGLYNNLFCLPIFGPGGIVIAEHVFTPQSKSGAKAFMTAGASGNITPIVLGALPHAEQIFLSESPWDLFAVADRLELYRDPSFALLATRGASNDKVLVHCPWPKVEPLSSAPIVILLTQNDKSKGLSGEPTANQRWVTNVRTLCPFPVNLWDPPANHHDFNDWTRDGVTRSELTKNYEYLLKFSSPFPPLKEEKSATPEPDTSWLKAETVDELALGR
jgi:hypothetical protein